MRYNQREIEKHAIKTTVKKEIQAARPEDWLDAVEGGLYLLSDEGSENDPAQVELDGPV